MFERFTDRARRVIVLAQEDARELGHNYIGTEHILLGLIHEGNGVAVDVLRRRGLSLEDVRVRVVEQIGRGQHENVSHIPFTPRAKTALELSLRESQQAGHNYIGTEHILLGLIREGQGVAAQVLADLGITLDEARQQVLELVGGGAGIEAAPEPELGPAAPRVVGTPLQLQGIMRQLSVINARLAAIERQLGVAPSGPAAPGPAAAPPAGAPPAGAPPDESGSPGQAGPQAG